MYFWNRTLHVSDRFSVHHQESRTVYTAICTRHTDYADSLLVGSGWNSILIPLTSSHHNLYDIYLLLCIQYETPDDGQKTCPKLVEFYSKNKFEKLVHLVSIMIRIVTLITVRWQLCTPLSLPKSKPNQMYPALTVPSDSSRFRPVFLWMLPSDVWSWRFRQTCTQTRQWGSERGNLQLRFPVHVQCVCLGPVYSPYANSPCSPWNLIVTHIVKISQNAESPCHAHSPLLGRCLQPDTHFRSLRLHPSGNPTRVCMKFIVPMSAIYGPGSSVGIATDYGLDGPGSNPGGDEIFRPSRPALGPTHLL